MYKIIFTLWAALTLSACGTVYNHTIPVEDIAQAEKKSNNKTAPKEEKVDLDTIEINVKEKPAEEIKEPEPSVAEEPSVTEEPPATVDLNANAETKKPAEMVKPVEIAKVDSKPASHLLNQANQAASAGNYSKANVLLDRALAISPRDSKLWHKKAQIMYRKGDYRQAASMAMRSNTMTSNPGMKKQNWRIIANAREKMGDLAGAEQARKFASE